MEIATDKFLAEIRRSHHVVSWVDVVSPTGERKRLSATGGSVTEDATADIRRRCSLSCYDATGELTPKTASDLLTPYGTELHPFRGVKYADGTTEVMPLGVYRISQVDVDDSVGGSPDIKLEAFDRSRTIVRDKFPEPYTVAKAANLVTAIKAIVERTFPGIQYDTITTTMTTTAPLVFDANTSPWEAVNTLAKSLGCEAYFNARGRFVLAPPPDIDALPGPDFEFVEGKGCTMTNIKSKFTDEPGYNGIVLVGASVGDDVAPVRSVQWDTEPTSPTYYLGPYGKVPDFQTDENVKTQADADSAAKSLLQGYLGFSDQVVITCWPNPALTASSIVRVERERSGAAGLYSVDAVTTPLSASEAGSVTVRRKRVIS